MTALKTIPHIEAPEVFSDPRRTTMELRPSTSPFPLEKSADFSDWFDTLPTITPRRLKTITCACCGWDHMPEKQQLESCDHYLLLRLPYGCITRSGCLYRAFGPGKGEREKCLKCGFRLFERIGVKRRLRKLIIGSEKMGDGEGCCGICGEEYAAVVAEVVAQQQRPEITADLAGCPDMGGEGSASGGDWVAEEDGFEPPVKLLCNHVFGLRCLFTWMNSKPEGGDSNTCPLCRKQILEV